MTDRFTVKGTLSDQTTLTLDEPISLPAGRVRVTVEPWPAATFWENVSVVELASAQRIKPVKNLDELCGTFWPEEEQWTISLIRSINGDAKPLSNYDTTARWLPTTL